MTTTLARPRTINTRPAADQPRVALHGNQLTVVFPTNCPLTPTDRDRYVRQLITDAQALVLSRRVRLALEKGLI